MRTLRENLDSAVDLGVVLMIGVVFAALMVMAYIIWTVQEQLLPYAPGSTPATWTAAQNSSYNTQWDSVARHCRSGFVHHDVS